MLIHNWDAMVPVSKFICVRSLEFDADSAMFIGVVRPHKNIVVNLAECQDAVVLHCSFGDFH